MKMTYTIVAEMSAAGAGGHRFLRRHEDSDGRVIIFQTYEEAVKRCEELNAKKVDRNEEDSSTLFIRVSTVHRRLAGDSRGDIGTS
jgi:hypothetical protein